MERLSTAQSEGKLSVNSRLSDTRREKLINLKQREDLKDALKGKFKGRFGSGANARGSDEVSVASSCIKREVDNFAQNAHVTEQNLGRLERRLQKKALTKPGGYAPSDVSAYSGISGMSRSRSLSGVGQSVINPESSPEAFDWCRLDEYASYLHEQDAIRQKLGVTALQQVENGP